MTFSYSSVVSSNDFCRLLSLMVAQPASNSVTSTLVRNCFIVTTGFCRCSMQNIIPVPAGSVGCWRGLFTVDVRKQPFEPLGEVLARQPFAFMGDFDLHHFVGIAFQFGIQPGNLVL